MEMLPSVPDWKSKKISLMGYPTSEPMYLFYRDALDCVEYLFGNPLFSNHMDFCPVRLYQDAEQTIRVYSEWMSGNAAWEMQVCFISGVPLACSKMLTVFSVNAPGRCNPPWRQPLVRQNQYICDDW
jgi:hypothetical protein